MSEFAILGGIFFFSMFAIIEISYKSILQAELDNLIYSVANDIAINSYDTDNVSEFLTSHVCQNAKPTFLNCRQIEIGADVLVNRFYTYGNQSFIGRWNIGCSGDPIMIEMNYPVQNLVHSIAIADIIERENVGYFRSRAVIRREPLIAGSTTC